MNFVFLPKEISNESDLSVLLVARRVTLVVALGFLPQNFGRLRGLQMVLCHSMNTD